MATTLKVRLGYFYYRLYPVCLVKSSVSFSSMHICTGAEIGSIRITTASFIVHFKKSESSFSKSGITCTALLSISEFCFVNS